MLEQNFGNIYLIYVNRRGARIDHFGFSGTFGGRGFHFGLQLSLRLLPQSAIRVRGANKRNDQRDHSGGSIFQVFRKKKR